MGNKTSRDRSLSPLTLLHGSNLPPITSIKASTGKYIACLYKAEGIYRIGEETSNRNSALQYCREYKQQLIQIFDDKGYHNFYGGLIKLADRPNHELNNQIPARLSWTYLLQRNL